ncbi:MAG: AMP-dependent synthetase/ligase [Nocardioidaceae bacterium]|nr:long-chain fatty acid--CoA ligase [Nocardioidaceae bacterium]
MLAYATAPTYDVPVRGSLTDDVVDALRERPGSVAFSRQDARRWRDVTVRTFHGDVTGVAKGLLAAGIQSGDRIAVLSKTRYEWTLFDYAIWWIGAVTVPVYETSSVEQISWVLSDSRAVACIVENDGHAAKVDASRAELPTLSHLWSIEGNAVSTLTSLGADVEDEALEKRRSVITPADLATVIYTSGTTGRPKGCCLSHGNFMFELGVCVDALDDLFDGEDASTLLFLPLAHVFARIIEVGCVRSGARLGHTADVKDLMGSFDAFGPRFILAVPRVFEKVFNSASQRAHSSGRGKVFDAAAETAIAYSQAQESGKRVNPLLRARHALFDRLVYARLRAALGGHVSYALAGGAPLGERLAHFFAGIGVPVLEGYGLTETTGALTVNLPGQSKIGTVGRPLPGTAVRVGEDGELLFRGGQVFSGYWENDAATKEVLDDDGWFHTGDVGEIDEEGFVRVAGRKKEILVTAGGKNIAPAALEDRIRAHPLVSQCIVVGDGKPFVAALMTLDAEAFDAWRTDAGKSGDVGRLRADPVLLAQIQVAVDDANAQVSKAESIRRFTILAEDWTEAMGLITPTLKVKRNAVLREFHDDIEALFT